MQNRVLRLAVGLARQLRPHVRGRRIPRRRDLSIAVPFAAELPRRSSSPPRVALVAHIFYPDLAAEILDCAQAVPSPVDVFITTDSEEKAALIRTAFSSFEGGPCEIRIVANRGRDIAPKLCACRDAFETHDLLLFLHGKRTPGFRHGEAWRRTLLASLAGNPDGVRSILAIFDTCPDVGMVICQHFEPIRRFVRWHHNFRAARHLAARMGIVLTPRHAIDMPSGSMFWARPAALRPLLDLDLGFDDFPEERGQTNGTLAHAIERLFLFVCEKAGYGWVKVGDPAFFREHSTVSRVSTPADLKRFVAEHGKSLLEYRW